MREGFEVAEAVLPWGTTWRGLVATVGSVPDQPPYGTVATRRVGPLEASSVYLRAPALDRPITTVAYELGDNRQLEPLDRAVAAWLGVAGFEVPRASEVVAPPGRTTTYRLPGLEVTLVAFSSARSSRFGAVHAGLYVHAEPSLLAGPYLASVLSADAPWRRGADEASSRVLARRVEALFFDAAPGEDLSARLAVETSRARACPAWLADRLVPGEVAIWDHPCGAWGLARTEACWVVSSTDRFVHTRALPARGPGLSALGWRGGEVVARASGGPAGLDSLAAELRGRGVDVAIDECVDD